MQGHSSKDSSKSLASWELMGEPKQAGLSNLGMSFPGALIKTLNAAWECHLARANVKLENLSIPLLDACSMQFFKVDPVVMTSSTMRQ